jgi:hypothetical protein
MEIAPGHEVNCFLYSWEKLRKEIAVQTLFGMICGRNPAYQSIESKGEQP